MVGQLFGGFQGQFTIVNRASTPIDNWELAAELPGDHIQSVWFGSYHTNGDTLYIDPASYQQKIGAGQSVTENFTASGSTTAPTSCTFNGSPC